MKGKVCTTKTGSGTFGFALVHTLTVKEKDLENSSVTNVNKTDSNDLDDFME